jgi:hypothetical protein
MSVVAGGQGEFDFEHELPAGKEFFTVPFLAALWDCDAKHVHNLIDKGAIKLSASLHSPEATKSMRRVPRSAVIEFLNRRRDQ